MKTIDVNEIRIKIADLESILTNCADDHDEFELNEMEEELDKLREQLELMPKEYTLDFIPDKTQIMRYGTYVSARCECPNDHMASYMFDYATNTISITLSRNGISMLSKMQKPSAKEPFQPMTLHRVERIATDIIIEYVIATSCYNLQNDVFSRLRPWDPDEGVHKLPKQKRYVFLAPIQDKILRVDGFHRGCGTGYRPGMRPYVLDGEWKVNDVASIPYKKSVCEIVRVIPAT